MSNKMLRAASLFILLAVLIPINHPVFAAPVLPPVDMFQLPWELGKSWVAYDGFDKGLRRPTTSPHNFNNGGAIDFAPHANMQKGENTSNAWVTAVADGTVAAVSACRLVIAHSGGWISEYQHLANFQVKLGDAVTRNQRLAVIANASTQQPVCRGSEDQDTPHLHFSVRPNMVGATFAGWEFKYSSLFNSTTFSKNGVNLGLFKPLLNEMSVSTTPTPIATTPSSSTATPTSSTPSTPTLIPTATSTAPSGPYISTTVNVPSVSVGNTAIVTVNLNNVPIAGYTSAEITCAYNATLVEASNIVFANLFGADPATTIFGPQGGSFIAAVAGSRGAKATTSGTVFTFTIRGLQAGQTAIDCTARVSQGTNTLVSIPYIGTSINVLGLPTPTPPVTSTVPPASPTSTLVATSTVSSATSPPATPTFTSLPTASPTPIASAIATETFTPLPSFTPLPTNTPLPSSTPTPPINGLLTGQVIASKPVTVSLFDGGNVLVASVIANPDGTFSLSAPAGTYTVRASANGFLSAQGSAVITAGNTTTKPTISLLAGDIDGNNVIDQFDALTIGINYNSAAPAAADLNNDAVINVLDLEALAQNYRKTGPILWE